MKYIDEFRNQDLVKNISKRIMAIELKQEINIMEVCGTHTMSFFKFGLRSLLPPNLRLISGPGCPVCVSDRDYIDKAIAYSTLNNVIVVTFADMLRVPGSNSTLEEQRSQGSDIRIAYSPREAVRIAQDNLRHNVIFLGIGFETTAPTIALTLLEAEKKKIKNLLFFSSLKLIPPAMECLLKDRQLNLHGFLCPGHVSTIIGTKGYAFIPQEHKIACCVCGFEPLDMMQAINNLLRQIVNRRPRVANQYMRFVKREGNKKAQEIIDKVFIKTSTSWRGIGKIANSGLKIRARFSNFDAEIVMPMNIRQKKENKKYHLCRCAEVLKGVIRPPDCPLFLKDCTPHNPDGPCMVSSEGACNVYYKYH